jgi:hypothetical protein
MVEHRTTNNAATDDDNTGMGFHKGNLLGMNKLRAKLRNESGLSKPDFSVKL